MAEECVSVSFETDGAVWEYCWDDGHPSPSWESSDVDTGLRPNLRGGQGRSWRTCQYYLAGMRPICSWWVEGTPSDDEETTTSGSFYCSYVQQNTSDNPANPPADVPTGFNNTSCDYLGRRQWCSHYEGGDADTTNTWICTAPNPYVSGLGRKSYANESAIFENVLREDIWGYNDAEDGTGTGKCDCYGMGRGNDGCGLVNDDAAKTEERLAKLPVKCNYYRPWQMGFGIIDPDGKDVGDVERDGVTITDQGWKRVQEWDNTKHYRLPLNYELFNNRALFQKCQWWDEEIARKYVIDYDTGFITLDGGDTIFNAAGKVEFCDCPDTNSNPYNTRIYKTEAISGEPKLPLDKVFAEGGGPVCNGVRPECPCYSGRWDYLTAERMLSGMPVTANQILELRFYSQDWDSQDAYDKYYSRKPNFDDPDTASIFTFTKWKTSEVGDAFLQGKELSLCVPAPLHNKVFNRDHIEVTDPVNYYKANIGTSTETGQRQYPSLVRDNNVPIVKPLVVTYPYYNDDAFDPEICKQPSEAGYNKVHNDIYGDSVRAVGHTIRDKRVHLINTSKIKLGNNILHDYAGVYAIKDVKSGRTAESIKNDIYNSLVEVVNRGYKEYPEYISSGNSDSIFGYFLLDPVKIKYGTTNMLLIAVDYGDGTWEYRWRFVINNLFAGIIKQTDFTHIYEDSEDGYANSAPERFSGRAYAVGSILYLGLANNKDERTTPEMLSTYSIENVKSGVRYYSWSMVEDNETDYFEAKWGAIGNTNKIFVEIDHTGANYVYDWEIESAKLILITETNDVGDEVPVRTGVPDEVELKKLIENDDALPPSACIFEPVDNNDVRIKFLSAEWELYITFKYEKLIDGSSAGDYDVVLGGAGKSGMDVYAPAPASLEYDENSLLVEDITRGSAQYLIHFKDKNQRITSAFATKFITKVVMESCRNIDIFYRYEAEGRKYVLQPEYGMCIDVKEDLPEHGTYKHVETPDCGDHENDPRLLEGPMWFPFNACRGYDMYDEFTICNNCQAGYVGPDNSGVARDEGGDPLYVGGGTVLVRKDYRYCGPYKYDAFGSVRGNWASSCDCGCRFSYSDASQASVLFAGYGRKRTTVSFAAFETAGWAQPPFGNDGRELVEKFLSVDYLDHPAPTDSLHRSEWMPIVMDHSIFFSTFNAYDSNPEDEYFGITEYYSFEPFRYTHQLNMGTLSSINEEVDPSTRHRWEDLFEVHHEGNCSYPLPVYPSGNATKALFYYLKPAWAAWAWQEGWKEIERNQSEENEVAKIGKLDFVELNKPKYIFDGYKAEHRRIADEKLYELEYKAPEIEDGEIVKHPTISLGSSNPRAFEILYDEDAYTDVQVTWKDEGGGAQVDGSSDSDNIYEETVKENSDWVNDPDIIFDGDATSEKGEENRFVYSMDIDGEPIYKYYNRGVIASITRKQLYSLPKEEVTLEYDGQQNSFNGGETSIPTSTSPDEIDYANKLLIPGNYVWNSTTVDIDSEGAGDEEGWAFLKLHVNGYWGKVDGLDLLGKPKIYSLPKAGVTISYEFIDETSGGPIGLTALATEVIDPVDGQEVEAYDVYLEFLVGPVEMLKKRVAAFSIHITGSEGGYISINDIELVQVEYENRTESIKVWERKYVSSNFTDVGSSAINLDGPGDHLYYDEDLLNSGQYFPFRTSTYAEEEITAMDKMRVVSCGVHYSEDETLVDLSYGTLHRIEEEEQKILYEYAYELDPDPDTNVYTAIIPIKYAHYIGTYSLDMPLKDLYITSEKLPWEQHSLVKRFEQFDFWRPGGHYYTWNERFYMEKCTIFGAAQGKFEGKYVHLDHQAVGNPATAGTIPVDPGNSFYSLRFYTQKAKYDRAMILAGGEPASSDRSNLTGLLGLGGTFVDPTS